MKLKTVKRKDISDQLDEIGKANFKKYHSTMIAHAVYNLMEKKCILAQKGDDDIIIVDRYKTMIKNYKKNAQDPWEFKVEDIHPLARIAFESPDSIVFIK